jgi:hypothetical protein
MNFWNTFRGRVIAAIPQGQWTSDDAAEVAAHQTQANPITPDMQQTGAYRSNTLMGFASATQRK